ncbi:MAG: DNA mismatch repair protein MutS [Planctomycetota bacterium]
MPTAADPQPTKTASQAEPKPASRPKSGSRDTPAMRQYLRFKSEHPDCVLFFRMGDFYEMFDDDAVTVHQALGLTLTERSSGIPMAGVPHHSVETYIRRMIEQGFRVAVCDQIQDPKEAKGVVDRAVTRVLTPGTLVDESLLDEAAPNLVAALHYPEGAASNLVVLATAEVSTGTLVIHDIPASRLLDELARIGPAELLYEEAHDGSTPPIVDRLRSILDCAVTARPGWTFRERDANDLLLEQFGVQHLAGFGIEGGDPAIAAAGALVRYLQETQAPDGAAGRLGHLRPPLRRAAGDALAIDATSLRSLEIERTMRSGQVDGSLLSIMQKCVTPMGKRLLRAWLCFPRRDRATIERRQDAVALLVDQRDEADALVGRLRGVQDVARIVGRLGIGRATPRDLRGLGTSIGGTESAGAGVAGLDGLQAILEGSPSLAPHAERLRAIAGELSPLADAILASVVEAPPAHGRDGGIFRDGIDAELDEARGLQRDANSWLAEYQARLTAETGIPSLKVGFNKVFGYYIEVTHVHVSKVPDTFSRKQTLKNAERYITPELKTFEDKVLTAESRAIEREQTLFGELCTNTARHATALATFADLIAELDVLACFATVAVNGSWIRPDMVDEPVLDIREGRHPVLAHLLRDRFVPNDTTLGHVPAREEGGDDHHATLAIITGPNMAGKSTAIRQVAIIALLAHTGSFVPASRATIGLADRIFTRIGAADELHTGQSTFMVEMTETANILHHATDRSLVILDEIGRGTSTLDGLSLAWAIAETLAATGARTLFATHYHELTGLADRLESVTNLHVSVREWGDEIIFLYRILPGRTDRSYGIHVARIAGVPEATIQRADELLETLAVQTEPHVVPPPAAPPAANSQMGLFTEFLPHPVVAEIERMDLDGLTPLQAFDTLRTLIDRVKNPS